MPFRLEFFAVITITEREHQAIKLDDHTQVKSVAARHVYGLLSKALMTCGKPNRNLKMSRCMFNPHR